MGKPDRQMKAEVSKVFHGSQAVDIALFGRMLANAPDLNTDASAQVAHAISVDRVDQDFDYFTAVDDCAADDNAGAGMIGTVSFNSSTLYRYATVDIDSLYGQLGDPEAAACGVAAFVEAFVKSMPTGKQNTFANRTLPNAVVVAIRKSQPINAVSAFEVPVRPSEDESVSRHAAALLGEKLAAIEKAFDEPSVCAWNVVDGASVTQLDAISRGVSMRELLSQLHDEIRGVALAGADGR